MEKLPTVENLIENAIALVLRFLRTIGHLLFRPRHYLDLIQDQKATERQFVRPATLTMVCLMVWFSLVGSTTSKSFVVWANHIDRAEGLTIRQVALADIPLTALTLVLGSITAQLVTRNRETRRTAATLFAYAYSAAHIAVVCLMAYVLISREARNDGIAVLLSGAVAFWILIIAGSVSALRQAKDQGRERRPSLHTRALIGTGVFVVIAALALLDVWMSSQLTLNEETVVAEVVQWQPPAKGRTNVGFDLMVTSRDTVPCVLTAFAFRLKEGDSNRVFPITIDHMEVSGTATSAILLEPGKTQILHLAGNLRQKSDGESLRNHLPSLQVEMLEAGVHWTE